MVFEVRMQRWLPSGLYLTCLKPCPLRVNKDDRR
jgi:hypothetical protein